MIKGIKIFSILILIFAFFSFSESNNKRYRIYIAEYDYFFTPQNGCLDTIAGALRDKKSLRISLYSCLGKMHVQVFDSNKIKIEEGNYINSLDLLKRYSNAVSMRPLQSRIKVYSYYQPLRSGEWLFYNSKGILQLKKRYDKGTIVDSTDVINKQEVIK